MQGRRPQGRGGHLVQELFTAQAGPPDSVRLWPRVPAQVQKRLWLRRVAPQDQGSLRSRSARPWRQLLQPRASFF